MIIRLAGCLSHLTTASHGWLPWWMRQLFQPTWHIGWHILTKIAEAFSGGEQSQDIPSLVAWKCWVLTQTCAGLHGSGWFPFRVKVLYRTFLKNQYEWLPKQPRADGHGREFQKPWLFHPLVVLNYVPFQKTPQWATFPARFQHPCAMFIPRKRDQGNRSDWTSTGILSQTLIATSLCGSMLPHVQFRLRFSFMAYCPVIRSWHFGIFPFFWDRLSDRPTIFCGVPINIYSNKLYVISINIRHTNYIVSWHHLSSTNIFSSYPAETPIQIVVVISCNIHFWVTN